MFENIFYVLITEEGVIFIITTNLLMSLFIDIENKKYQNIIIISFLKEYFLVINSINK